MTMQPLAARFKKPY